jgi:hypothetical protein
MMRPAGIDLLGARPTPPPDRRVRRGALHLSGSIPGGPPQAAGAGPHSPAGEPVRRSAMGVPAAARLRGAV